MASTARQSGRGRRCTMRTDEKTSMLPEISPTQNNCAPVITREPDTAKRCVHDIIRVGFTFKCFIKKSF